MSKIARDGKAALTNNGKPAAIMLHVDTESFERIFGLVQEIGKLDTVAKINSSAIDNKERACGGH